MEDLGDRMIALLAALVPVLAAAAVVVGRAPGEQDSVPQTSIIFRHESMWQRKPRLLSNTFLQPLLCRGDPTAYYSFGTALPQIQQNFNFNVDE